MSAWKSFKMKFDNPRRPVADAILDRLVHNAHRLTLKGESLRKSSRQASQP